MVELTHEPGQTLDVASRVIYMDANATTAVSAEVLRAMLPWFSENFGNAASMHSYGRASAAAVYRARNDVALLVGVSSRDVVFTSGATEASNLALRGVGGLVCCSAVEHRAVLDTVRALGGSIIKVDDDGRVDIRDLARVLNSGVSVVSVMLANNETGVLNDLKAVAELAHSAGALVHSDVTQAVGKIPMDLVELGVDMASMSAHKLHGPKGVGALIVRQGVRLSSIMTGGGHERGVRSGTLNTPGIVGFGAAAALARPDVWAARATQVCDVLVEGFERIDGAQVLSDHRKGLPNTVSVRFSGVDGEALMANCPGLAFSVGSACSSAVPEPSHVLVSMGVSVEEAFEAVRFSVDASVSPSMAESAVKIVAAAVRRIRAELGTPETRQANAT